MLECPNCKAQYEEGKKFCKKCGAELVKVAVEEVKSVTGVKPIAPEPQYISSIPIQQTISTPVKKEESLDELLSHSSLPAHLIENLKSDKYFDRCLVINEIAKIGGKEAIQVLEALLKTETNEEVKRVITEALGKTAKLTPPQTETNLLTKAKRPILVTIIAIFSLISAVFSIISIFSRYSAVIFGVRLWGYEATVAYLILGGVDLYKGIMLLKMKKIGWILTIIIVCFNIASIGISMIKYGFNIISLFIIILSISILLYLYKIKDKFI